MTYHFYRLLFSCYACPVSIPLLHHSSLMAGSGRSGRSVVVGKPDEIISGFRQAASLAARQHYWTKYLILLGKKTGLLHTFNPMEQLALMLAVVKNIPQWKNFLTFTDTCVQLSELFFCKFQNTLCFFHIS